MNADLRCFGLALLSLSCVYAGSATAQSYPTRSVQIIVPFPTGGATDVTSRVLAQGLTERMGQSVVVINRPGGSATIGMNSVAKAKPDGYTLGVASLSFVYNHHERELAERIAGHQHDHHDLTVASLHVHLDHENCLENVVLQGPVAAVRSLAGRLTAEPGVRHGALNVVSVETGERHSHAPWAPGASPHLHLKPRY